MLKGGKYPSVLSVTERVYYAPIRTAFILGQLESASAVLELSAWPLPQEGKLGREPGGRGGFS